MALTAILTLLSVTVATALATRIFYNLYLHPLSKFPGPWYAASSSLSSALISVARVEPQWLLSLTRKYGTTRPIRITPSMLLFPRPSAIKEIYRDPKLNYKSDFHGTGTLGPPHLFTTLDADEHKALRKALGGPVWSFGSLKNNWESRIDDQVNLFIEKMTEKAEANEPVILSDKVAEFAADIMTMISFTVPWGFVRNSRDEKHLLQSWREGLDFFGFAARFRFFRRYVINSKLGSKYLLPKMSDKTGMGYLASEADRQIIDREKAIDEGFVQEKPDLMQHCLEARINGQPLNPVQKRAHVTLLIQAGADTTGTALGCTLRYLMINPDKLKHIQDHIAAAEAAGHLSTPVQYEEVRQHLPFFVACIKESLRLDPPAPSLFPRLTPKHEAKVIDGFLVPPNMEITTNPYVASRDPVIYAPDPEAFRPERWLESQEKWNEMDASQFVFGMGPRVCLGKDIAVMEMYKLLPEVVRRFEFDLKDKGKFVVAGGAAHNKNLLVQLRRRDIAT